MVGFVVLLLNGVRMCMYVCFFKVAKCIRNISFCVHELMCVCVVVLGRLLMVSSFVLLQLAARALNVVFVVDVVVVVGRMEERMEAMARPHINTLLWGWKGEFAWSLIYMFWMSCRVASISSESNLFFSRSLIMSSILCVDLKAGLLMCVFFGLYVSGLVN